MKYDQQEIRTNFIKRLKTQSRLYNSLDLHFLPKIYTNIAKNQKEHQQALNLLYHSLYKTIKIEVNGIWYYVEDIVYIKIVGGKVLIKIRKKPDQILMEKFIVKSNDLSEISIDHHTSFYNLVNEYKTKLPILKQISHNHLNKLPQNIDVKKMVEEIKFLYEKCDLRLMPKHLNISKGKK